MLLFSAISSAISVALSFFWAAVRSFVMSAVEKIKQVLMGAAVDALSLFVRKTSEGIKELSYNYIKDGGRYLEKIVSKSINEADLPDDIQSRVSKNYGKEVDITNDFARELQLS